jgi:hypothetical protein
MPRWDRAEHRVLERCHSAKQFDVLRKAGAGVYGVVFAVGALLQSPLLLWCQRGLLCTFAILYIVHLFTLIGLCSRWHLASIQARCNQPGHPGPDTVYAIKMAYNKDGDSTNTIHERFLVCSLSGLLGGPWPWHMRARGVTEVPVAAALLCRTSA